MAEAPPQVWPRRKISFIIEKLADRSGGAERVLIEMANALTRRGHQVEILTHEHRGKPPFYPLAFGVIHTNLRPPRAIRKRPRRQIDRARERLHRSKTYFFPLDRALWLSKHGGFWRRLQRHLTLHRPDVAIAFMPPAITALALAKPGYDVRKVASMHNAPEQDFHNPARWDPNPLDRRQRLALMPEMDLIMVLLPEYRDWYQPPLRAKSAVVPNMVIPNPPALLKGPRGKTVLSVGRLAAVKRHDLLIDGWAGLVDEFPDWTLRIYGTGPLEAGLAAQIKELGLEEQVRLMGHTPEIAEQYLSAALLAHPAEYEGFPLAVTESLAAGLPVVGFEDCSGVNRLVMPGKNGVLVPVGSDRQSSFITALAALMRDEDTRKALGRQAPETVGAYAPDKVVDLWESLLFLDDMLLQELKPS